MNDKQIKRKEAAAYTLMALLLLLSGVILFRMDHARMKIKAQAQNQMRLDSIAEMIQYMESIQAASEASFDNHLQKDLRFMAMTSADPAAEDGSAGRQLIRDEEEEPYAYLRSKGFLDMVKRSFDGVLLLLSTADEQLPVIWQSASLSDAESTPDLNITPEMITKQQRIVKTAGSRWFCTYAKIEDSGAVLIYLTPLRSLILRSLFHVGLPEVSALVIFVTILTYFFSVLKYSRTHQLTKQQSAQYHPKALRRNIITAGLAGALIMFISTAVLQTMDALHEESIIGAREISDLFAYVGNTVSKRIEDEKQREDQWYVDHGEHIASLIAWDPESVSREDLQKFCDLFDIDYIMLFDPQGKETVSSADYVGFTMDAGLGENSGDFRRLLLGVPSIVHDISSDPVTGLERQHIGVRVPLRGRSGGTEYGALLMAVSPRIILTDVADIIGNFHFIDEENRLYFYSDQGTGKILYASDSSIVGKTIMDHGLPERSLQDGYTDFTTFNGVNSYVTMIKQQIALNFFYVIRSSALFSSTLPMASAVLICYLVTAQILGWFCLKDYKDETFETVVKDKDQMAERNTVNEFNSANSPIYSEFLISKNRSGTGWEDKTPESKVGTIWKIDMILLVILPLLVYSKIYGDSSLLRFILTGNWMRGVNMFSFCAIVIVMIVGVLVVMICSGILSLIAGFTGRSGETICRLLYSLIQYMAILNILYFVFEYVGLSMSTYIASLGAASLALSIGAQGMVADILAGVLIVFEHQFQVGDIVEIDGSRGTVLEIGVRSTRLLDQNNDVRFISNSNIRNIVNKSIRNSAYTAEFNIVTQQSLEQIEAFFERELSAIGQKSDMIISGPVLHGIVRVSGSVKSDRGKIVTVCIGFECQERDSEQVKAFITREFYMLCEREEIELLDSDLRQSRFRFDA